MQGEQPVVETHDAATIARRPEGGERRPAVAIDLDGALGDTRALWEDWLADAARRYASIAPLDVASLPADRAAAAEVLDRWSESGVGDWRASLERFAEDHAPVYLRPAADASAALRRIAASGRQVGVFTDAPEALVRVALAHLGATRRTDAVEAGAGALERLLERLGAEVVVVRTREDLLALA